MPTLLSDKYKEVFAAMAESEEEDKPQMTADEFARAIEEADEIVLDGDLQIDGDIGFYGTVPQPRPNVPFNAVDLTELIDTVDNLVQALVDLGLITSS